MFGYAPDGRPMMLLGLSDENVARLGAGDPIRVLLPEQAAGALEELRLVVAIVGGHTEADIAETVAGSPLAGYLRANPPTPDQARYADAVPADVLALIEGYGLARERAGHITGLHRDELTAEAAEALVTARRAVVDTWRKIKVALATTTI